MFKSYCRLWFWFGPCSMCILPKERSKMLSSRVQDGLNYDTQHVKKKENKQKNPTANQINAAL